MWYRLRSDARACGGCAAGHRRQPLDETVYVGNYLCLRIGPSTESTEDFLAPFDAEFIGLHDGIGCAAMRERAVACVAGKRPAAAPRRYHLWR